MARQAVHTHPRSFRRRTPPTNPLRTVIYNVTKSAVGVIVYRRVGNRYIEKRVNVRVEHINHSRSREEFIRRVKENAARKKEAKESGKSVQLKRQPVMPRDSTTVEMTDIESIAPIPYDTHI